MTGKLIERFDITPPEGPCMVGYLYQTQRRTGRRIVVRDLARAGAATAKE